MTDPVTNPIPPPTPEPEVTPNLWRPADETLPVRAEAAKPSFVLGIVGDSGSGKNTVADAVANLLGNDRITEVQLDDYHRYTREERTQRGLTALNPVVHNLALMQEHLRLLRQGRPIRNRSYSHTDGTFGPIRLISSSDIVLVRGLLGFPTRELQNLYNLSVFLQPEPELLFRWKLRRDVRFRGYKEAEVLKNIARHLLDSKEYVLPQAERAHVLVHYQLPDWEAPDDEVQTTVHLRREAAQMARETALFGSIEVEQEEAGEDIVIQVPSGITDADVDSWARARFPESYDPEAAGRYFDEDGTAKRRPTLALVEVLIADLANRMSGTLANG